MNRAQRSASASPEDHVGIGFEEPAECGPRRLGRRGCLGRAGGGEARSDQRRDPGDDVFGDRDVEGLLAAEVVDDRREVGLRLRCDLPRRGALEAVAAEDVERRLDQPLPRLRTAVVTGTAVVALALDRGHGGRHGLRRA